MSQNAGLSSEETGRGGPGLERSQGRMNDSVSRRQKHVVGGR